MSKYLRYHSFVFLISLTFNLVYLSLPSKADEYNLPETVRENIPYPLEKVGQGTYRKFGFRIYEATLWATQSTWDASKPYALELHYIHSLSKETLVDTVMDDINEQGVADESTRSRWRDLLNASLSDIKEDDVLVGLTVPGKKTLLFFNGFKIASIDDPVFSDAFFGIWLGKNADEDLREKLLGATFTAAPTRE